MNFKDYLKILNNTWEPEKRKDIFTRMLEVGNFDELSNYHGSSLELNDRELILDAIIKKATLDQLNQLYRFVVSPHDKEKIAAEIDVINYKISIENSKISLKSADESVQNKYDVFISHATEDKARFVRQLANELTNRNVTVWYDELTLKVGDSLRQSIEKGLANSIYGVVVLSPNFFAKKYPQDELNGLTILERKSNKVILPVWLDVDEDYIAKFAPMLADRFAAKASDGMEKVITDLLAVIKP